MIEDARTGAEGAAYRGFLFSDLRGFTAFAERHGNAVAASVVGRFLKIARAAIARHSGAEIKTEGDAIHAVFPSASAAVICGLEIVERAADLNPGQPERAIGIGVGIHAGEAVETAEGFIGTAVNLAARVCAIARPGEVLVTSTVKGIIQASIPVGFVSRGRRRLKGIREPVELFAITRDASTKTTRVLPQRMLLGAAGVAVAFVLIATAVLGRTILLDPGASPTSTTGPAPLPVVVGPLPIGRYESQAFQPPVAFDIVDQGWTANRDVPEMLGLVREVAPRGGVSFLRVQELIANPCVEGGDVGQTAPAAGDLLSMLGRLQHVTLANSQPTSVGGHAGTQVDVTVSASAQAACGGLVGGGVALFAAGGEVWRAWPGERFRLVVVDVGGQAVAIVSSTDWTQTPSVQELESLLELAQRVLDSVAF